MSKFVLDLDDDFPFVVFGITATTKDYRLCWSLNKELGFSFKRLNPLEVYSKQREKIDHGFFCFEDDTLQIKYRLIENKRGASKFLPEIAQADFILVIDESPALDGEKLLRQIKKIRSVLMAFKINLDDLKFKDNILLTA